MRLLRGIGVGPVIDVGKRQSRVEILRNRKPGRRRAPVPTTNARIETEAAHAGSKRHEHTPRISLSQSEFRC